MENTTTGTNPKLNSMKSSLVAYPFGSMRALSSLTSANDSRKPNRSHLHVTSNPALSFSLQYILNVRMACKSERCQRRYCPEPHFFCLAPSSFSTNLHDLRQIHEHVLLVRVILLRQPNPYVERPHLHGPPRCLPRRGGGGGEGLDQHLGRRDVLCVGAFGVGCF